MKNAPPAPDGDAMKAALRLKLQKRVAALERQAARAARDGGKTTRAFRRALEDARENLADYEDLLRDPPPGFALVPVLCVPVEEKKKSYDEGTVFGEYTSVVRAQTLKRLAAQHEPALRALGMCDQGILRMHKGKEPMTITGEFYDLDIDHHRIEQVMAGSMAARKTQDPALPESPKSARFPVNHQDNLMLVTGEFHRRKNRLHTYQSPPRARAKKKTSRKPLPYYRLTLVSIDGAAVTPPQPRDPKFRPHHPTRCVRRIEHLRALADEAAYALTQDSVADAALVLCRAMAARSGAPASERAERDGLTDIFTQAVGKAAPEIGVMIETALKPALRTLTMHLRHTFAEVSRDLWVPANDKTYRDFAEMYGTKRMRSLRTRVDNLPFNEAAEMRAACAEIDRAMDILAPRRAVYAAQRVRARQDREDYEKSLVRKCG